MHDGQYASTRQGWNAETGLPGSGVVLADCICHVLPGIAEKGPIARLACRCGRMTLLFAVPESATASVNADYRRAEVIIGADNQLPGPGSQKSVW